MMARARLFALCLAALALSIVEIPGALAQDDDAEQGDAGQGFGFPGQGFGFPGQNGQQQRGGRRGQGGFGQGGFGQGGFGQGMMPGGFGFPGGFGQGFFGGMGRNGRTSGMMGSPNDPFQLLKSEAVREELKLTKKQIAQIDKLVEAYQKDGSEQLQQTRLDRDELEAMSDSERTKAIEKSRDQQEKAVRKLNDKYRPRLSKLLKPDQEKRLKQISWQVIGVAALRGDDLAKALKLSKDQRAEIDDAYDEAGKKMRESFRPPEGGFRGRGPAGGSDQPPADGDNRADRPAAFGQRGQDGEDGQGGGRPSGRDFRERFENMRKMNDERDAKVLAVLTDKQRKQYEQLKGDPFDVSQLWPRRGRGRGGQRGGEDQADRGGDRADRGGDQAGRGADRADRGGDARSDRGNERTQARGTGRRRAQDDSE